MIVELAQSKVKIECWWRGILLIAPWPNLASFAFAHRRCYTEYLHQSEWALMQNLGIRAPRALVLIALGLSTPALSAPSEKSLIVGEPRAIDLYPESCLPQGLPSSPRDPAVEIDIALLDPSAQGDAQFVPAQAIVWREPCSDEKSVILVKVDYPGGEQASQALLRLPTVKLPQTTCGRFLDGRLSRSLDNYDLAAGVLLGERTDQRVFSLALLGLDDPGSERDSIPLSECPINGQLSLSFEVTSASTFVDTGNGVGQIVPGVTRSTSLSLPAYDPELYPEAQLTDLLTGHATGSYYDSDRPGEGLTIEIARVDGRDVFVLTWYTFDANGAPFWLVGASALEAGQRSVTLLLSSSRGGGFAGAFNATAVQTLPWGTISLQLSQCNTLDFSFASTHNSPSMPMGSGERRWQRLTSISRLGCD